MSVTSDYKELIKAHNGDMALLYIYMNCCEKYDREKAAIQLDMTMQQVMDAEEKLERAGLKETKGDVLIIPVAHIDALLAFPIDGLALYYLYVCRHGADNIEKAAECLQRPLENIAELKNKLGILRLLPESDRSPKIVPVENFPHPEPAAERESATEAPAGEQRVETPEASAPVKPESAAVPEQPADPKAERKELIRLFAEAVGISDRQLNPQERKYITDWIDLFGFRDPEVAVIAYERTVKNQQSFRWAYANAIMKSWYEQKLFTTGDILECDKRHRSTSRSSKAREAERAARRQKMGTGVTEADYDFDAMLREMGKAKKPEAETAEKLKSAKPAQTVGDIDLDELRSLQGRI